MKTIPSPTLSLTFDAILGALAVLSIAGCSKSESAAPAPESNESSRASSVNAAAPPTPTAVALPPPAASTANNNDAPAVDAGKDIPPAGVLKPTKKAGASCGATGCSPDMKKNGK